MRTLNIPLLLIALSFTAAELRADGDAPRGRRVPLAQASTAFVYRIFLPPEQMAAVAKVRQQYEPKFAPLQKTEDQIAAGKTLSPEDMAAFTARKSALVNEYRAALMRVLTPQQRMQLSLSAGPAASTPPPTDTVVEPVVAGPTDDGEELGSTDIAPPVEIKLPDVRWQAMPAEFASAAVSPDGRVWYLMARPAEAAELRQSAVRQVVEREFAKPAPQLQGVKCVFFETASNQDEGRAKLKRVWMMCRQGGVLLGYDGKQWIERRLKFGMLPEGFNETRSFFQMDGGVAFLDTTGCNVLQGDKWIYRNFFAGNHPSATDRWAWPDADGKGLLVLATDRLHTRLWHYRDGAWKDAPWPDRFVMCHPPRIGDSFYIVSNRMPAVQRQAFLRHGTKPPEPTITKIDIDGTVAKVDLQQTVKLGAYRISVTCEMTSDCDGTIYALCEEAYKGTRRLGPGVLVCNRSGAANYVASRDEMPLSYRGCTLPNVWLAGGKRAWKSFKLMDMEKLTTLDSLPASGLEVVAATDEGCVFARHLQGAFREGSGPLMVYRPTVADARKVLAGANFKEIGPFCISGDGRITAGYGDSFKRFDGETWRPCKGVDTSHVGVPLDSYALIPGQNGCP